MLVSSQRYQFIEKNIALLLTGKMNKNEISQEIKDLFDRFEESVG